MAGNVPQNTSVHDHNMTLNQNDVWVPFVEPISGMGHLGNPDVPWDFFNVVGVENENATLWPSATNPFYQEPQHRAWF